MCIKKRNKSHFMNCLLWTINRLLNVRLGDFPPPFV